MDENREKSEETDDTHENSKPFVFEYCSDSDFDVTFTGDLSSLEKIRPAEDYKL